MSGSGKPVLILGAPFVFSRKKLAKPFHVQRVELELYPVTCHAACGVYYISAPAGLADDRCPTCQERPKPWRIGAKERVEVEVKLAFGNVREVDFRASLGPVAAHLRLSRRSLVVTSQPPAVSTARVHSPQFR